MLETPDGPIFESNAIARYGKDRFYVPWPLGLGFAFWFPGNSTIIGT